MSPAMNSRNNAPGPDLAKLMFAIIPVVSPPSNAIMHGSLSAVMAGVADSDLLRQTRNDAVTAMNDAVTTMAKLDQEKEELKRAQGELSAQKALFADTVMKFIDVVGKGAVLLDRVQQHRADQEKFAEPISTPGQGPSTDDIEAPGITSEHPAELLPVTADEILPPAVTEAKDPEQYGLGPDDPELEADEELPAPLANLEPEASPPRGSVTAQPISVSLSSK
jgi:hypothetical protein